jgi:hypothetical protein
VGIYLSSSTGSALPIATATLATVATLGDKTAATVAGVATVAVANRIHHPIIFLQSPRLRTLNWQLLIHR